MVYPIVKLKVKINPLNAELNPICHLLALVGAHHIPHVRRVRVKQTVYIPGQALRVLGVEAARFKDSQNMKVVRLSPLRTGRLYPPKNIPGTRIC